MGRKAGRSPCFSLVRTGEVTIKRYFAPQAYDFPYRADRVPPPLSVLYVDDEAGLLEIAQLFLERDGEFTVTTVLSAKEALASSGIPAYDAIVADYQMPEMDGIALLKEVRRQYGDIPFILFTGRGREEVVIEAINNGVDFYLQKGGDPVAQFAELAHKIRVAVKRRKAEGARRESEEKYRTLFETTGTAMVLIEEDTTLSLVNNEFLQKTGYSREEVENRKKWTEFVVKEDLDRMLSQHALRRTDHDKALTHYEFGLLTKSGAVRDIHLTIDTIPGTKKSVASLLDITDRKRAEEALRESEAKFRSIVETSPNIIWEIDVRGTTVYISPGIREIVGFSPEEIIGRSFMEMLPPSQKEAAVQMFKNILVTGKPPVSFEIPVANSNGQMRIIEIRPFVMRGNDGKITGLRGVAIDITGHKEAEEKLRESERMVRAIFDSTFQFTGIVSPEGILLDANRTALDFVGVSLSAVVNRPFWDGPWWNDDKEKVERLRQAIHDAAGGAFVRYEAGFRGANGSRVFTDFSLKPVRSSDGTVRMLVAEARDITERVLAEEARKKSEEQFSLLFDHMNEGVALHEIITGPDGKPADYRILATNRIYECHTGLSRSAVVGKTASEAYGTREPPYLDVYGRVAITGTPEVFEAYFAPLKKHFRISVYSPGKNQFATVFFDITASKEAQEALLAKTREMDTFFQTSRDLFCIADTDGYFRRLNPEWEKTLGYPVAELEGKRFLDYVHPDDRTATLAALADLSGQRPVINFTNRFRAMDGTYRWIEWRSVPQGNLIYAAARDITHHYLDEHYSAGLGVLKRDLLLAAPTEKKLKRITDCCVSLFGADFARIWMTRPGDLCEKGCIHAGVSTGSGACRDHASCLHLVVSSGRYMHTDGSHRRMPFGAYKIGRIGSGDEERIVTNDVIHDPRIHDRAWAESLGLVSFAGFRILSPAGKPVGVLAFFSRQPVLPEMIAYLDDLTLTASHVIQTALAEEALQESEQSYRSIIENMQEMFYRADLAGNLTLVSPAGARLVGYDSPDQMIGKNIADYWVHPAGRKKFVEILERDGSVLGYPATVRDRYGSVHYLSTSCHLYRDKNGTVLGIEGVAHDITALREAEEALQAAREKYSTIFRDAPDAITISELETGVFIEVNDAATRIFGYSRDELVGHNAVDLGIWQSREQREAFISRLQKERRVEQYESVERRKSGELFYAHTNADIITIGDRRCFLAIIRDVTREKQVEEALKKGRDELETRVQERTAALAESEERLRLKLDSVLSPQSSINGLELANILDIPEIQSLMEDFSNLTGMGTAILDLKGNILESSGWQEICTRFHRANEKTAAFCRESDTALTRGEIPPGQYVMYKCKNGLWDIATPIYLGTKHAGNVYIGQFFLADETVDRDAFGARAEECGFDRDAYLAALSRVSRFTREQVGVFMDYMVRFTGLISRLSYSNLKLAQAMTRQEQAAEELRNLSEDLDKRVVARTAELSLTQDAYRRANQKLNLLTSITRHDITNQLIILQGYLELSQTSGGNPQTAAEFLQKSNRAIETIRHQIEFTRVYQDLGTQAPAWQDVEDSVRQAARELDLSRISLDIPGMHGVEIFADPMLHKVFFNLFDNALRYGGEKMTQIRVTVQESGDVLLIACEDDGNGIDADEKERIFERGYGKNTGLGLFLVRQILGITGMMITETGSPGTGARFEITVPKAAYRYSKS